MITKVRSAERVCARRGCPTRDRVVEQRHLDDLLALAEGAGETFTEHD